MVAMKGGRKLRVPFNIQNIMNLKEHLSYIPKFSPGDLVQSQAISEDVALIVGRQRCREGMVWYRVLWVGSTRVTDALCITADSRWTRIASADTMSG